MKVEVDEHLISAGQCFFFLLSIESSMRDFVILADASDNMRSRYNAMEDKKIPSEFSRSRRESYCLDFKIIKDKFLSRFPEWRSDRQILESIERVVIYRNGFAHSHVQPFREYLLYTPNQQTMRSIQEFTRCGDCMNYLKDCDCKRDNLAEPTTLVFRCLDEFFLDQIYGDIKTIDQECFLPTARKLNIRYNGFAWPDESGGYEITKFIPSC